MNLILMLIMLLFSVPVGAACKCNCTPTDTSLCAPNYDLDNPCTGLCPNGGAGVSPMPTACPLTQALNPISKEVIWMSDCPP